MKKRIITISIISSLLLVTIVGIICIVTYSSNKKTTEGYHTMQESKSYVYEEGRRMSFTVYSETYNTLIRDTKNNSYILRLGPLSYELENVEVERYKLDDLCLIKIYADIPFSSKTISSDSARLQIITVKYTLDLKIGSLSILNPSEYELLGVDTLYGSYSIVDGLKILVGINIKFSKEYIKMRDFKVGEYTYGNLAQSFESNNLPNEININDYITSYNPYRVERSEGIDVNNYTYFIPLNYITLGVIRHSYITIELDGNKYYIDDFSFMTNEFDYDEYKDKMKDGEFI